jgi:hypothetical protein
MRKRGEGRDEQVSENAAHRENHNLAVGDALTIGAALGDS